MCSNLLFNVIKIISPILLKLIEFLEPEEMSVSDYTELQKTMDLKISLCFLSFGRTPMLPFSRLGKVLLHLELSRLAASSETTTTF